MNAIIQLKPWQNTLAMLVLAVCITPLPVAAQAAVDQESFRPSVPAQPSLNIASSAQSYSVLHVDAATGSDEPGFGSAEQPYRTITQALQMAPNTSTVILLAPGHYSRASGEQFPLRLRPGITIQGNAGETRNTIIVGGGELQSGNGTQNATILMTDRSGLANVAVSNPKGSGVWVTAGTPIVRRVAFVSNAVAGMQISEGSPVVENSYFNRNQYGMTIQGNGHATIRENYFEATGRAITVVSPAVPVINNNRIARNSVGIALKNNARPVLEANVLNDNRRNGIVEVDEPTTAIVSVPAASVPAASASANTETVAVKVSEGQEQPAVLTNQDSDNDIASVRQRNSQNAAAVLPTNPEARNSDEAIAIAVIPAESSEVIQNETPEQRDGISKLLARLRRSPETAIPTAENHSVTTPNTSVVPDRAVANTAGQRLPVPSAVIPSSRSSNRLTPPGTIAVAETFRYRVLVDMADVDALHPLVPDAFRTQLGSQTFMQAGAYVNQAEAQTQLEWLEEQGIDAQLNVRP